MDRAPSRYVGAVVLIEWFAVWLLSQKRIKSTVAICNIVGAPITDRICDELVCHEDELLCGELLGCHDDYLSCFNYPQTIVSITACKGNCQNKTSMDFSMLLIEYHEGSLLKQERPIWVHLTLVR